MSGTPKPIETLIKRFGALPGLGPRSARRIVFHLLAKKTGTLEALALALEDAASKIKNCSLCGNLDTQDPCAICSDPARDSRLLCIVATLSDLAAIERARIFHGRYLILGGIMSALDGVTPDDLNIDLLRRRLATEPPQEIVLALNATVEGQATAHYILDILDNYKTIAVSRLGQGVPFGSELDYLDDSTISAALSARTRY